MALPLESVLGFGLVPRLPQLFLGLVPDAQRLGFFALQAVDLIAPLLCVGLGGPLLLRGGLLRRRRFRQRVRFRLHGRKFRNSAARHRAGTCPVGVVLFEALFEACHLGTGIVECFERAGQFIDAPLSVGVRLLRPQVCQMGGRIVGAEQCVRIGPGGLCGSEQRGGGRLPADPGLGQFQFVAVPRQERFRRRERFRRAEWFRRIWNTRAGAGQWRPVRIPVEALGDRVRVRLVPGRVLVRRITQKVRLGERVEHEDDVLRSRLAVHDPGDRLRHIGELIHPHPHQAGVRVGVIAGQMLVVHQVIDDLLHLIPGELRVFRPGRCLLAFDGGAAREGIRLRVVFDLRQQRAHARGQFVDDPGDVRIGDGADVPDLQQSLPDIGDRVPDLGRIVGRELVEGISGDQIDGLVDHRQLPVDIGTAQVDALVRVDQFLADAIDQFLRTDAPLLFPILVQRLDHAVRELIVAAELVVFFVGPFLHLPPVRDIPIDRALQPLRDLGPLRIVRVLVGVPPADHRLNVGLRRAMPLDRRPLGGERGKSLQPGSRLDPVADRRMPVDPIPHHRNLDHVEQCAQIPLHGIEIATGVHGGDVFRRDTTLEVCDRRADRVHRQHVSRYLSRWDIRERCRQVVAEVAEPAPPVRVTRVLFILRFAADFAAPLGFGGIHRMPLTARVLPADEQQPGITVDPAGGDALHSRTAHRHLLPRTVRLGDNLPVFDARLPHHRMCHNGFGKDGVGEVPVVPGPRVVEFRARTEHDDPRPLAEDDADPVVDHPAHLAALGHDEVAPQAGNPGHLVLQPACGVVGREHVARRVVQRVEQAVPLDGRIGVVRDPVPLIPQRFFQLMTLRTEIRLRNPERPGQIRHQRAPRLDIAEDLGVLAGHPIEVAGEIVGRRSITADARVVQLRQARVRVGDGRVETVEFRDRIDQPPDRPVVLFHVGTRNTFSHKLFRGVQRAGDPRPSGPRLVVEFEHPALERVAGQLPDAEAVGQFVPLHPGGFALPCQLPPLLEQAVVLRRRGLASNGRFAFGGQPRQLAIDPGDVGILVGNLVDQLLQLVDARQLARHLLAHLHGATPQLLQGALQEVRVQCDPVGRRRNSESPRQLVALLQQCVAFGDHTITFSVQRGLARLDRVFRSRCALGRSRILAGTPAVVRAFFTRISDWLWRFRRLLASARACGLRFRSWGRIFTRPYLHITRMRDLAAGFGLVAALRPHTYRLIGSVRGRLRRAGQHAVGDVAGELRAHRQHLRRPFGVVGPHLRGPVDGFDIRDPPHLHRVLGGHPRPPFRGLGPHARGPLVGGLPATAAVVARGVRVARPIGRHPGRCVGGRMRCAFGHRNPLWPSAVRRRSRLGTRQPWGQRVGAQLRQVGQQLVHDLCGLARAVAVQLDVAESVGHCFARVEDAVHVEAVATELAQPIVVARFGIGKRGVLRGQLLVVVLQNLVDIGQRVRVTRIDRSQAGPLAVEVHHVAVFVQDHLEDRAIREGLVESSLVYAQLDFLPEGIQAADEIPADLYRLGVSRAGLGVDGRHDLGQGPVTERPDTDTAQRHVRVLGPHFDDAPGDFAGHRGIDTGLVEPVHQQTGVLGQLLADLRGVHRRPLVDDRRLRLTAVRTVRAVGHVERGCRVARRQLRGGLSVARQMVRRHLRRIVRCRTRPRLGRRNFLRASRIHRTRPRLLGSGARPRLGCRILLRARRIRVYLPCATAVDLPDRRGFGRLARPCTVTRSTIEAALQGGVGRRVFRVPIGGAFGPGEHVVAVGAERRVPGTAAERKLRSVQQGRHRAVVVGQSGGPSIPQHLIRGLDLGVAERIVRMRILLRRRHIRVGVLAVQLRFHAPQIVYQSRMQVRLGDDIGPLTVRRFVDAPGLAVDADGHARALRIS
ncbi:hypothetical protein NONI108955_40845 [Nocardia ninae]